jgi:hypothetical protein
MVASAPGEASGKTSSRISPRAEEDAEGDADGDAEEDEEDDEGARGAFVSFTDGNVSVRTEAGVDVVAGELFGCAASEVLGGAVFFSAGAFSEFCFAEAADDFGAGVASRRAGRSAVLGLAGGGAAG